ncbi:TPA: hypothetical protein DEO28_00775 [Candidatus Dependentiae bacterium]|nr:MAG: Na+ antiporter NhaC [candidate division TM6 bacterium GW2011_GWE2_31_21]KKP54127.1 MAG: Na+ antiporter NhaC [candidate division TM6 bacterium GW2011_GWF2_33_332]HBS47848.1 hypothetical protein [Candidatus Dependentiae bacterium]HBZ73033.1 hypothetical protein [Candidatus Dependentiae bacterium]
MQPTWLSLLPPFIVLVSAFITKKIVRSLIFGIFAAGLIATNFSVIDSIKLVLIKMWNNSEIGLLSSWSSFWGSSSLFIYSFLIIVGILITLIAHSGGAFAYSNLMKKKIKNVEAAETATFFLSSSLFIDDYFNSLTVGSVMHSLTDAFRIPRVKLAFLVDSMAAPLCILSPISSWAGFILMQMQKSGISTSTANNSNLINAQPFYVYLHTLPYVFYSIILIASVFFIIRRKISFGSMRKYEESAKKTGNLFGNSKELKNEMPLVKEANKKNSNAIDMFLPILMLIGAVFLSMLFCGNFYLFGGSNSFLNALQNINSSKALFLGGLFTVVVTTLFFLIRKKINISSLPSICKEGTVLMFSSIIILILAWTFGDILSKNLETGVYLAQNLISSVDIRFLPFLFFLTGAITSFSTGSSWGAMAILLPIAMPMLISFSHATTPAEVTNIIGIFPTLGAILAGAVFGDHTSPVAVTSIMSAKSSGCHLMDHIQTQLTYALPVFIGTSIAFLFAGFLNNLSYSANLAISLGSGIIISFTILAIRNWMQKK